jgi:hypothetical protein
VANNEKQPPPKPKVPLGPMKRGANTNGGKKTIIKRGN